MSYVLDQFIQTEVLPVDTMDSINIDYMTPIVDNYTVIINGIKYSVGFNANKIYYFHGKIRKETNIQTLYIYLIKADASASDEKKQYLRTLNIDAKTEANQWIDIELIFTPYLNEFDTILFEPQTNVTPIICYEELDEVNNIIGNKIAIGEQNIKLTKMGVQSTPYLSMVLNGESIHIGKSGIYEIKNNTISIYSFSVVSAGIENSTLGPNRDKNLEQYLSTLSASACIFNNGKKRGIKAFVVDYIYNKEV